MHQQNFNLMQFVNKLNEDCFFLWDIYNEEQEKVNFIIEDYEVLFMQIFLSNIVHFDICFFLSSGKDFRRSLTCPYMFIVILYDTVCAKNVSIF